MNAQTGYLLSEQSLQIATGILDFIEDTFDAFPNTAEESVKRRWVLLVLIFSFRRKNAIARTSSHISLPVIANKSLIGQNIATLHTDQNGFCGISFI
jgi:hypothetical protein